MSHDIYEVEREDYKNFIEQLNKEMIDTIVYSYQNCSFTKVFSKKTKKHLSTRVSDSDLKEEHYFIFNYPDDDERCTPKPVCRITLNTKEEVQAFFDVLNKMKKEAKENAGAV